MIKCDADSV